MKNSSPSPSTGNKQRRGGRLLHKVAIVFFGNYLLYHENKSVKSENPGLNLLGNDFQKEEQQQEKMVTQTNPEGSEAATESTFG